MKNKIFTTFIASFLILTLSIPIYARSSDREFTNNEDKISRKELQAIAENYGIVISEISDFEKTITVENLVEFEEICKSFKKETDPKKIYFESTVSNALLSKRSTTLAINTNKSNDTVTGSKSIYKWCPWVVPTLSPALTVFNGITCYFDYEYTINSNGVPRFTDISDVDSKALGLCIGGGWEHVNEDVDYKHTSTYTKASIEVEGIASLGITIGNQNIGLSLPKTITYSYKITK